LHSKGAEVVAKTRQTRVTGDHTMKMGGGNGGLACPDHDLVKI
jgi:hypothetical protein